MTARLDPTQLESLKYKTRIGSSYSNKHIILAHTMVLITSVKRFLAQADEGGVHLVMVKLLLIDVRLMFWGIFFIGG
jgi:hypothetical protein